MNKLDRARDYFDYLDNKYHFDIQEGIDFKLLLNEVEDKNDN